MTDLCDTRSFKLRKWTLFAVCVSYTLLMIIVLLMPAYFAESIYNEYENTSIVDHIKQQTSINMRKKSGSNSGSVSVNPEVIKNNLKKAIFCGAFLLFCFALMGIIGAYMEDHCLSTAFAASMIFCTFINICPFVITIKGFCLAMVNLAVTILAFWFTLNLKKIGEQLHALPMVAMQTSQPMTQTVIPLYPTAVIGYQYPQQQQQQQYNTGMGVYGGSSLQEEPPRYSDMRDIEPSGRKYYYPRIEIFSLTFYRQRQAYVFDNFRP